MKKFFIFTTLLIGSLCYSEELKMNQKLRDGMNYYFEKLIPSYYAGNLDTREEKNNIVRKCHMYIYGSDCFSDNNGLLFNFYYLINHDYQSGQGIQLTKIEYEGNQPVYSKSDLLELKVICERDCEGIND